MDCPQFFPLDLGGDALVGRLHRLTIPRGERDLLVAVHDLAADHELWSGRRADLATALECSVDTVSRRAQRLEARQLLGVDRWSGTVSAYRICWSAVIDQAAGDVGPAPHPRQPAATHGARRQPAAGQLPLPFERSAPAGSSAGQLAQEIGATLLVLLGLCGRFAVATLRRRPACNRLQPAATPGAPPPILNSDSMLNPHSNAVHRTGTKRRKGVAATPYRSFGGRRSLTESCLRSPAVLTELHRYWVAAYGAPDDDVHRLRLATAAAYASRKSAEEKVQAGAYFVQALRVGLDEGTWFGEQVDEQAATSLVRAMFPPQPPAAAAADLAAAIAGPSPAGRPSREEQLARLDARYAVGVP